MEKEIKGITSVSRPLTENAISLQVSLRRERKGNVIVTQKYDVIANKNGDISCSPEADELSKGTIFSHCKERVKIAFPKE